VHDAVMIEAPAAEIEDAVGQTRAAMAEASRVVLAGFEIGTDTKTVCWPDRYVDEAGAEFWGTVLRIAGPVPTSAIPPNQFGNPAEPVRQSCRSSSAILPNRAGLIRESLR